MSEQEDIQIGFSMSMMEMFRKASSIVAKRPSMLRSAMKVLRSQSRAAKVRERWRKEGLNVPPFMIFTVTSRCNLECKGCYSRGIHDASRQDLDIGTIDRVLDEVEELGISIVLLSGGEPLSRPEVIGAAASHRKTLFALFTNGSLLSSSILKVVKKAGNIVPILSLEGFGPQTDERRGAGTYEQLLIKMEDLKRTGLFYGCSITVTNRNMATVASKEFIEHLYIKGARLFLFVEYVPVQPGTEGLVLNEGQANEFRQRIDGIEKKIEALFISFPGDEQRWGGCISSGMGFFHIGPSGDVEPCPFAPFSDRNIKDQSLKEALSSPLLAKVREAHSELKETSGGCALWQRREWLRELSGRPGN